MSEPKAVRSGFVLTYVSIAVAVVTLAQSPANARSFQPEQDQLLEMLDAAVADVKGMLDERRGWVGRPKADQLRVSGPNWDWDSYDLYASRFDPYDEKAAAKTAQEWLDLFEEDRRTYLSGLQADYAAVFWRWNARLEHTAEELQVLHLEFVKAQHELREHLPARLANWEGERDEVYEAAVARSLAGLEQAALRRLIAGRLDAIERHSEAKAALAEDIERWYGSDPEHPFGTYLVWSEQVMGHVAALDLFALGKVRVKMEYYKPVQEDMFGLEGKIARADDEKIGMLAIFHFEHPDYIEPQMPFEVPPPAPPTPNIPLSVTTSKSTYLAGDPITVVARGTPNSLGFRVAGYLSIVVVPADSEDHPFPRAPEPERDDNDWGLDRLDIPPPVPPLYIEGGNVRVRSLRVPLPMRSPDYTLEFELEGLPAGKYEVRTIDIKDDRDWNFDWEIIERHEFTVTGEIEELEWPEYPSIARLYPRHFIRADVFGMGMPTPSPPRWKEMLPEDLGAQFNEAWVLLTPVGRNIFRDIDGPPVIEFEDSYIDEYRVLQTTTLELNDLEIDERFGKVWQAFRSNLHWARNPNALEAHLAGADALIVMAKVRLGSPAGVHTLKINGAPCDWVQSSPTAFGDVDIVREYRTREYDPLATVYLHDTFRVRITTTMKIEADELPFFMQAQGAGDPPRTRRIEIGEVKEWVAKRIPGTHDQYLSKPFFINPANAGNRNPDPSVPVIKLSDGEVLLAQTPRVGLVLPRMPAVVGVTSSPARVDSLWAEAIFKAVKASGKEPEGNINAQSREKLAELLQSGFFPGASEFKTRVDVGDVAAMILMRDVFISDLTRVRQKLDSIRTASKDDKAAADALMVFLGEAAKGPESAVGRIDVPPHPDWPLYPGAVPFNFIYDDEFMGREFGERTALRHRWRRFALRYALDRYIEIVDDTLERAKATRDNDAAGLILLTGTHFETIGRRLRPNLLRLREDRAKGHLWWEQDPLAQAYMGSIPELFAMWHANADVLKKEHEVILVASTLIFFAPEYVVFRIASTITAYALLAESLAHDIPAYFTERAEVQFAQGAAMILGEGRLTEADINQRPAAGVLLNLFGSVTGVPAEMARLVQGRQVGKLSAHARAVLETAEEGGLPAVLTMSKTDQAALLGTITEAEKLSDAGKTLTLDQEFTVGIARQLQEEAGTLSVKGMPDGTGTIAAAAPSAEDLRLHQLLMKTEPPPAAGEQLKTWIQAAEDQAAMGIGAVPGGRRLQPDQPWHIFDVGEWIAQGAYAQVYGMKEPKNSVVKVFEASDEGRDAVQRSLVVQEMLEKAGVAQLRIVDVGEHRGMPYLVQERMPRNAVLYKPVAGKLMDNDMQTALLELYKKLGKSGIGWEDGHRKNIYFFKDDGLTMAGVLDQDRMWDIAKPVREGAFPASFVETMEVVLQVPSRFGMRSIKGVTYTPQAKQLAKAGYCVFPDAEYLMMKMLEHKGWVRFDREAGKFVSERMDIDLVREYFPLLDAPGSIDTVFDVPDDLRHLVPGNPGVFGPIGFVEVVPRVEWGVAVAA